MRKMLMVVVLSCPLTFLVTPAVTAASLHAEEPHPGCPLGKHLSLPAAAFVEGDTVRLSWFDTPGNAQDWVSVVQAGQADQTWHSWTYTNGKLEGTFEASDLPAGDYEARLYHDWPNGGFRVVERIKFTVVPDAPAVTKPVIGTKHLALPMTVFPSTMPVVVGWHDTPGNPGDWITVVPAGTPKTEWGEWMYTGKKKNGSFQVGHLAPGAYQARLYLDWPKGGFRVVDSIGFSVQ